MPPQLPGKGTPIEKGMLARVGRGVRASLKEVAPGLQWLGPAEPLKPASQSAVSGFGCRVAGGGIGVSGVRGSARPAYVRIGDVEDLRGG